MGGPQDHAHPHKCSIIRLVCSCFVPPTYGPSVRAVAHTADTQRAGQNTEPGPRRLPSNISLASFTFVAMYELPPESGWLATIILLCASFILSSGALSRTPSICAASRRVMSGRNPPFKYCRILGGAVLKACQACIAVRPAYAATATLQPTISGVAIAGKTCSVCSRAPAHGSGSAPLETDAPGRYRDAQYVSSRTEAQGSSENLSR